MLTHFSLSYHTHCTVQEHISQTHISWFICHTWCVMASHSKLHPYEYSNIIWYWGPFLRMTLFKIISDMLGLQYWSFTIFRSFIMQHAVCGPSAIHRYKCHAVIEYSKSQCQFAHSICWPLLNNLRFDYGDYSSIKCILYSYTMLYISHTHTHTHILHHII